MQESESYEQEIAKLVAIGKELADAIPKTHVQQSTPQREDVAPYKRATLVDLAALERAFNRA